MTSRLAGKVGVPLVAVIAGLVPAGCRLRTLQIEDRDAIPGADRRAYEAAADPGAGAGGKGGGGSAGTGADGGGGTGADGGGCSSIPEMCNGLDDNCDGQVDEGYDLATNAFHCGACGNACKSPHAIPTCVASTCGMGECVTGFFDANKDPADGCECVRSNGGIEICDDRDNDCNNVIDEGFDKMNDPAHCGSCIKVCGFANAKSICSMGACKLTECLPSFYDIDKAPSNGCEYACIKSGVEVCDGFDNDCDGMADNGMIKGVGDPCGAPEAGVGECKSGSKICVKGVYLCMGATFPAAELCNDKDDDCNGTTDNGFDKMNDPLHCGGCSPCPTPAHVAVSGCGGGTCNIAVCDPGYTDEDGMFGNGCESSCIGGGPEICDGNDNDCDGKTDEADPSIVYPSNFCLQTGECANGPGGSVHYSEKTFPVCMKVGSAPPDWICNYPSTVETTSPGVVAPDETLCDDRDNDCDNGTDEPFGGKGDPCYDSGIGACRRTGMQGCKSDKTGLECNFSGPAPSPGPEVCNGVDDDCNGTDDEILAGNGFTDNFVMVGGVAFFAYEASRPDATGTAKGTKISPRPCSLAGKLPWADVTKEEAATACAGVGGGWRLCSKDEWQNACNGPANTTFPYGSTYAGATCNGNDYPDPGDAIPTGDAASCKSDNGSGQFLYDMSGNVREWVTNGAAYQLRGGAYDTLSFTVGGSTTAPGLQCDAAVAAPSSAVRLPAVGFRCCHTGAFP